jgi:hypothetical protein
MTAMACMEYLNNGVDGVEIWIYDGPCESLIWKNLAWIWNQPDIVVVSKILTRFSKNRIGQQLKVL